MDSRIVQFSVGLSFFLLGLFIAISNILRILGLTDNATRAAVSNWLSIIVAVVCIITAILVFIDARNSE